MSGERGSFLESFLSSGRIERTAKVQEYMSYRLKHGASLSEVVREDYVRRNCSQAEIDGIIRDPKLIHEDREALEHLFESGELDYSSTRRKPEE